MRLNVLARSGDVAGRQRLLELVDRPPGAGRQVSTRVASAGPAGRSGLRLSLDGVIADGLTGARSARVHGRRYWGRHLGSRRGFFERHRHAASVRMGGDKFDEAITHYVRRHYGILIGEATAERIKIEIGSAYLGEQLREITIKGQTFSEGMPRSFTLNSNEIPEALAEPCQGIVHAVRQALEETPSDLGSDVAERGIVLAGGGALLRDIDLLITQQTGLAVLIADDP